MKNVSNSCDWEGKNYGEGLGERACGLENLCWLGNSHLRVLCTAGAITHPST